MLTTLHIKNIAVISELSVDFTAGFNVLTGETGAGKSIIVDSLNMVLGGRANKELIRTGEKRGAVTAVFAIPNAAALTEEFGIEAEDGELMLWRELTAEGKSSCRINGQPVTAAVLREIGKGLINFHGQQDNQALLSQSKHLAFLDSYADISDELSEYRELYNISREIKRQLSAYGMDEKQKAMRIDMLSFQVEEIAAAKLKSGEEDALVSRRRYLESAEKIQSGLNSAYSALWGGGQQTPVSNMLNLVNKRLNEVVQYEPRVTGLQERLSEIALDIEDIAEQLREFQEEAEFQPAELDKIESRLDTIYKLKRKYGNNVDEILQHYQAALTELDELKNSEELFNELSERLSKAEKQQQQAADKLTALRVQHAETLQSQIEAQLKDLDMTRVQFIVSITQCEMDSTGADKVEFFISPNPGEPPKPLSKIASGGEMSRIMLAIKTILAKKDPVETLIFDEIDAGVSGRAANRIADKLRFIAKDKQVLCISHLAQIAAAAHTHFLIQKEMTLTETYTTVTPLSGKKRETEIARIIGGDIITENTLLSAKEMIYATNK